MANLLGQNIGTNYKGILNLNTLNGNLSATLEAVTDGDGNASPLNLATGSIRFGGATGLFWDNANNRLGVGNNAPTVPFDVTGNVRFRNNVNINGQIFNANSGILDVNGILYANAVTNGIGVGVSATSARLHVRGDGTNPILRLETSGAGDAFVFRDTTQLQFGSQGNYISSTANGSTSSVVGRGLLFVGQSGQTIHQFNFISSNAEGSGTIGGINLSGTYTAGSGSALYQPLRIAYTINTSGAQTGTATGIFLNATETALNGITHNLMNLQVGGSVIFKVSNNGAVEVNSTTQGFLPPRMTTTQVNAIASPAEGLVVYSTTENQLCLYNGTAWRKLNDSPL